MKLPLKYEIQYKFLENWSSYKCLGQRIKKLILVKSPIGRRMNPEVRDFIVIFEGDIRCFLPGMLSEKDAQWTLRNELANQTRKTEYEEVRKQKINIIIINQYGKLLSGVKVIVNENSSGPNLINQTTNQSGSVSRKVAIERPTRIFVKATKDFFETWVGEFPIYNNGLDLSITMIDLVQRRMDGTFLENPNSINVSRDFSAIIKESVEEKKKELPEELQRFADILDEE